MKTLKCLFIVIFSVFFVGIIHANSQPEEIELITYYGPPISPASDGSMYFDDGTNAARDRGLYVHDNQNGGWLPVNIPRGGIIMWSGSVASIPAGWALCNGQTISGLITPDLRNRFIVGAGDAYTVGARGGANEVTLTIQQMPAHSHTGSTDSRGGHSHRLSGKPMSNINLQTGNMCVGYHRSGGDATTNHTGDHSHRITMNNTGGGHSHENRPPYYALCYIIKL